MLDLLVAWLIASLCPTPTAWIEPVDGQFVPVCGDEDGDAVRL